LISGLLIIFFHFDVSASAVENRKENREETLFPLGFPPILELRSNPE
jgi:hypothetical protein